MTISADSPPPAAARPLQRTTAGHALPPSFAFMWPRASRWIAFGFGSGLVAVAPGTAGTLWAWAVFAALDPWVSDGTWALILPLAFVLGCWACARTGAALGVPDHSAMVWDEVVAFWAVLWLVPAGWQAQAAAFFLFRAFDVLKPPPIRQIDRQIKGGLGVMLDDLMAGFYTVLVFALWRALA